MAIELLLLLLLVLMLPREPSDDLSKLVDSAESNSNTSPVSRAKEKQFNHFILRFRRNLSKLALLQSLCEELADIDEHILLICRRSFKFSPLSIHEYLQHSSFSLYAFFVKISIALIFSPSVLGSPSVLVQIYRQRYPIKDLSRKKFNICSLLAGQEFVSLHQSNYVIHLCFNFPFQAERDSKHTRQIAGK